MWKCLKCGTENEWNFCTECRSSKEENEPKDVTPQDEAKEEPSEEVKLDETVVYPSPVSEEVLPEQPIPQEVLSEHPEPVNSNEGSGKKGCVIAIIVALVIVSLVGGLIFTAFNMLFGARESEVRVEVVTEEDTEVEVERPEIVEIEGENPFNFRVWQGGDVVQIENGDVVLDIPLPPDASEEDVDVYGSTFRFSQGEDDNWYGIWVILRNQMVDDFRTYSDYEVERALYWHNEFSDVTRYDEFFEGDATLIVIEWEDEFDEGVTFTLIRQYKGFILLVDLSFYTTENKEDLFEVYGFNERFYEVIQGVIESREATRDRPAVDDGNDRGEEVEWTFDQRNSWWDLMEELWEVADPSFDMFFYIWDTVILDDTVLDDYPNADVERLRELHEEFDSRFDELIGFDAEADFTLSYDHEDNRNAFRDLRELISEHERFYREFRAALEGR